MKMPSAHVMRLRAVVVAGSFFHQGNHYGDCRVCMPHTGPPGHVNHSLGMHLSAFAPAWLSITGLKSCIILTREDSFARVYNN
jgi:hypothetical protein